MLLTLRDNWCEGEHELMNYSCVEHEHMIKHGWMDGIQPQLNPVCLVKAAESCFLLNLLLKLLKISTKQQKHAVLIVVTTGE